MLFGYAQKLFGQQQSKNFPPIFEMGGILLASFSATRTPGSAGESKKNYIEKRPSGIMKERSANCTNKIRGGLFRWKKT